MKRSRHFGGLAKGNDERDTARHGYEAALSHAKKHRHLEKLLCAFKQERQQISPTVRSNKTLIHWLTNHIQEVDIRVGSFLGEKS